MGPYWFHARVDWVGAQHKLGSQAQVEPKRYCKVCYTFLKLRTSFMGATTRIRAETPTRSKSRLKSSGLWSPSCIWGDAQLSHEQNSSRAHHGLQEKTACSRHLSCIALAIRFHMVPLHTPQRPKMLSRLREIPQFVHVTMLNLQQRYLHGLALLRMNFSLLRFIGHVHREPAGAFSPVFHDQLGLKLSRKRDNLNTYQTPNR